MNRTGLLLTLGIGLAVLAGAYAARGPLSRVTTPGASAGVEKCHELIDNFTDYPIVYLGDEFEGLPLTYCEHAHTNGTGYGIPPTDQVVLIYGTCTPVGGIDASCEPPLQVHIYPSCMPIPVQAPGNAFTTDRGVDLAMLNRTDVFAEAGDYHVKIAAAGVSDAASERSLRAFGALRGANPRAAAITAESSLALSQAEGAGGGASAAPCS